MDTNILDTLDMKDLGRKLQEARKKRGLTQIEAADIINVARTTITAIEKGERRVKAGELIQLANAYKYRVSDFVRPRPTFEPFQIQFRSSYRRTDEDDQEISEYIDIFEELCRDYFELEQIVETPLTYKYPQEYKIDTLPLERAAEAIAQEERNRLGLGDGPIPILRDLLEQEVGLRIFYLEMRPSDKFSAMYTYDENLGGCIAVNSLHPEERRRMSLAHDYAHFLVDRRKPEVSVSNGYQRYAISEQFADRFALYFMMPTSGLVRQFNRIRQTQERFTPADLCTLAYYYGVSVEGLTRQLEGLKLLPSGTWDKLRDSGFKVQKAQQELGLKPIPANEDMTPKRYSYLALYAYNQELITEGQFAHFLRVDRLKARQIGRGLQEQTSNLLDGTLPEFKVAQHPAN